MDPRLREFYEFLVQEAEGTGECVYTPEQLVVAKETAKGILDEFVSRFGTPERPVDRRKGGRI
jgi:hypothetical protein